jgi:hypothetical protein
VASGGVARTRQDDILFSSGKYPNIYFNDIRVITLATILGKLVEN